jgi:ATP-dependent exoDNAse (exonuclease V) beta subunit
VLVDEFQDVNLLQWKMIQKLFRKRTRFVCVGDKFQSIYSFQGADKEVFETVKSYPKTTTLPLSYSYRCPKKVVEEANKVFNFIESPEWKEDGEIVYDGNFDDVKEGDFILCRNNSPLIETFLFLTKKGKRCKILGRDLGNGLLNVLNKIEDFSKESKEELLKNKREQLKEKGVINVTNNSSYNELIERIFILEELHKEFQDISVLKSTIEDMFADERNLSTKDFVVLSTIHRSKGLESDCVFFLYPDLLPSKYAESELELYSEDCLRYVCITRSKKKLIYVDSIR